MWKKLVNIIKQIPHPEYKNYGGYYRRCRNKKLGICPIPTDWMDAEFQEHDRGMSDKDLVKRLKKGNPNKLGWYGKAYRLVSILVFSIIARLQ